MQPAVGEKEDDSIQEVWPNKVAEDFKAESSVKKSSWSEFPHFPVDQFSSNEKENEISNESSSDEEVTTQTSITSNSTSVSTSIYVVMNTR